MKYGILLSLLLVGACAKKGEETSSNPNTATSAATKLPEGNNAKSYAEKLLRIPVTNWKPIANGEADFVYKRMTFSADNTWAANAQMTAQGETVDCQESGTWVMESAEAENIATMEWTVQKTNCPGRNENSIIRVKATIKDGEYDIMFR